jgi:hypothetical protein
MPLSPCDKTQGDTAPMSKTKDQRPEPAPKLAYSVQQFAAATDTSPSFIWQQIGKGELESCKAGDRRLITPEQGQRWLERKAEEARAKADQGLRRGRKPRSAA